MYTVSNEKSKAVRKVDYNYGIDLFRILAMIMVIILHLLSHGGIWESSTTLTIHNELAWLLGIGAYCAVNSYALISGYVGYGKKQKYSNLLYLYFQVLFYTLTSTALFAYFKPEWVTIQLVINAIIPFLNNTYWYFIGYFCLFFFMPFFNIALDTFDKVIIEKLLFTMFIIFSLFPTLFHSDIAFTNNGFSFLWLASMYIAGAWIKKRKISEMHYNNKINLLIYLICVIFTWFSKILIEILNLNIFGNLKDGTYLISYTSPTIIVCSVTLLLFFSRLNCGKRLIKFIRFFAPASFGIYLFHEEPLIKNLLIRNKFEHYLSLNSFLMILAIILTALAIGLIGTVIDKIRLKLFNIMRIRQFCCHIENHILNIRQDKL